MVDRLVSVNNAAGTRSFVIRYVLPGPINLTIRGKRWQGRTINDQPQHNTILAASNVTSGSTCHHSAASRTQRVPRDTAEHNRKKKYNQVLAGMLQYVQVTPKGNLVERTICPHELAVPLLDFLQARQAVAWLASLPAAERTGRRDLHALCCVTSALLGNLLALATGT